MSNKITTKTEAFGPSQKQLNTSKESVNGKDIYDEQEQQAQEDALNDFQSPQVKQEEGFADKSRKSYKKQGLNRENVLQSSQATAMITIEEMDKMFQYDRNGEKIDTTELINLRANKQFEYRPPRVSTQYLRTNRVIQQDTSKKGKAHNPKIRDQSSDFTSMRYECFCKKSYLSYCAFYYHLKNHHQKFLNKHRKFSSTHVIRLKHPQHGYTIKKLLPQPVSRDQRKAVQAQNKALEEEKNYSQRITRSEKLQALEEIDQSEEMKQEITEEMTVDQLKEVLKKVETEVEKQSKQLKYYERKIRLTSSVAADYHKMVEHFNNIIRIINIEPINQTLKTDEQLQQEVLYSS